MKATFDDVNLILKLYDMRREDRLREARKGYKNPRELKNLEDAARAYILWWNAQTPGAHDAFTKRVRG